MYTLAIIGIKSYCLNENVKKQNLHQSNIGCHQTKVIKDVIIALFQTLNVNLDIYCK